MELKVKKAVEILSKCNFLVVLTGSGVSAESGIPTFRGKDGLWKNFRAEELATKSAFEKNPKLVWEWYDWRRQIINKARLNRAHLAIARLEKMFEQFFLITQNVDGLHSRAGNKKLAELHGNIWRLRCTTCGKVSFNVDVPLKEIPPICKCSGILRPDIVWFGESLQERNLAKTYASTSECDVMLVVGTSGIVYPAASIPFIAKDRGARIIEVNLEETPITQIADVSIFSKAGEILPKLKK
ncbi:NAD-dependent deacylase [candidate division WOR-3 bacterium]|nr:NAD-dependent deacylase [candidate division WOR-3 bacterium]